MQEMTSRIANYVAQLQFEQLPEQVIEQVKMFIVDYYAASFAGYRINTALNEKVQQLMMQMGGSEEAGVLCASQKLPASNAAFMNAIYAHGADMDDGNRKAAGHIAAHLMSALFALAEANKKTWKELIVAIVAGYDVFNHVVGAAQPGLYNKGFHSTGVGGSLACAAAGAKLLGLDSEGIYNAISLSAIQSSGLIIVDESGQGCKPINPANAARTGVISAQLAQMGLKSSRNPLESKKGWFHEFADAIDEETLLGGLGEKFTICESYLKLYPACRHTHCGIDGALEIRSKLLQDGGAVSDIESVQVFVYPSAIKSTGSIRYPETVDEAKFSIYYCIATALVKGTFGLQELDVKSCKDCLEMIPKIELIQDDTMEDRKAGIRGAKLYVRVKSGKLYEETVLVPKGEAKKPLTWDDMDRKMMECAGELYEPDTQKDLIDSIRNLDLDQVAQLWKP